MSIELTDQPSTVIELTQDSHPLILLDQTPTVLQIVNEVTDVLSVEVPGIQGATGPAGEGAGDDLPTFSLVFENQLV